MKDFDPIVQLKADTQIIAEVQKESVGILTIFAVLFILTVIVVYLFGD